MVTEDSWVSVLNYGATGDGVTNDTAAIQAALNDGRGIVYFPPGVYAITSVVLPDGVTMLGAGSGTGNVRGTPTGGATLLQGNGVNASAIQSPCASTTEYWHYSQVINMRIKKVENTTDTVGSGIDVNCRSGELLRFRELLIQNFPEYGIVYRHGGTNLSMSMLSIHRNGIYGINILRGGGDVYQVVRAQEISGDGNGVALINVASGGGATDTFHFSDIKAEAIGPAPVKQPTIFRLDTLNGSGVYIENVVGTSIDSMTTAEMIKIVGTNARVYGTNMRCQGCTNLITDGSTSTVVAYPSVIPYWFAHSFGRLMHLDTNGLLMTPVTGTVTNAAANNITLETLKRFTDTAPTGNFASYKNAAGTNLWNVDITGTLTAGVIPGVRVSGPVLSATGFEGNGTNCSAGSFALGVDASGNAEGCTALPVSACITAHTEDASASTACITEMIVPDGSTIVGGVVTLTAPSTVGADDVTSSIDVSVDGQIPVFDGTSGQRLRAATLTGVLQATAGVLDVATPGQDFVVPGVDINTLGQVVSTHLAAPLPIAQGGTGIATLVLPAGALVGTTDAQRLTSKGIDPRSISLAPDVGTIALSADTQDIAFAVDLTGDTTIANPTGSAAEGQSLRLRLRAVQTRQLTWGTAFSTDAGLALPSQVVGGTVLYLQFQWSSSTSAWTLISDPRQQATGCNTGVTPGAFTNANITVDAQRLHHCRSQWEPLAVGVEKQRVSWGMCSSKGSMASRVIAACWCMTLCRILPICKQAWRGRGRPLCSSLMLGARERW